MAFSNDQVNAGKLHIGPIPSEAIAGLTAGKVLPGLVTMPGPMYCGTVPALGLDRAALSVGTKIPIPGICGLEITAAPTALISNGINFLNGNTTITGTSLTVGADASAGVTAVAGAQAEAGAKANGSTQSTAGTNFASVFKSFLGSFSTVSAPFKTFDIKHTYKEGYRLVHASLEGPEMGVYRRGRTSSKCIQLPEYWRGLVDYSSVTVQLTPIGKACSSLHFKCIDEENNCIHIGHSAQSLEYFYIIHGERCDIGKLVVEYEGENVEDFKKSKHKYYDDKTQRIDRYTPQRCQHWTCNNG